jgi:RNA polymerase sigma factor (sigma-70 family)
LEDFREIIEGCIAGDNRARENLYRMLAPKMFGVCLRYAKDRAEAEDNLQDGFIKVYTTLKDFRFQGSFTGWVRRIMVTTSLDKYRNNHKLVRVEEMKKTDTPVEENMALTELPVEELINLIQKLPPRYRLVFNMFVMEGYNHLEISKELGISEGASKSNLSRAREILRNKLQFQYSEIRKNRRYSL